MPMPVSGRPSLACASAMRKSARAGQLQPAAQRMAVEHRDQRQAQPRQRVEGAVAGPHPAPPTSRCGGSPPQAAMSPPAQNALPSPVMIAARTSASASIASAAAAERRDHGDVERIELLRPRQRDDRDRGRRCRGGRAWLMPRAQPSPASCRPIRVGLEQAPASIALQVGGDLQRELRLREHVALEIRRPARSRSRRRRPASASSRSAR